MIESVYPRDPHMIIKSSNLGILPYLSKAADLHGVGSGKVCRAQLGSMGSIQHKSFSLFYGLAFLYPSQLNNCGICPLQSWGSYEEEREKK